MCLTSCSTLHRLHCLSQSQWMNMAAHSNRSQLHAMPCHCVFPCAWVPASICNFAITTGFQTTFGIQHLRSGQWGMVLPPKSNTCSKKMFVKLLGSDLQNICSTQSLSSSAPGLLASGIGSWPTCCSRATRSNATAVKAQQRVQSCLRLCRILQCHEIQGKQSAHTPLHTHRESLWSVALALGRGVSWHFDYNEYCITYVCVF